MTTPRRHQPDRWRRASARAAFAVAAVLALLVSVAGCGIPRDDDPEAIDRESVPGLLNPTSTSTVTTAPPGKGATVLLYFPDADGQELVPVERAAENNADPKGALLQLLAGPTEDERQSLTTSIPAGTELLDATLDEDEDLVTIDLSRGIDSIQGASLTNAFAQLVWTATSLTGIDRVRFQVEGEDRPALSDAGNLDEVTTDDYQGVNRPAE